ncbi:MAG: AtpZ/AtpI family protein [Acetobacteraceae bacterium]
MTEEPGGTNRSFEERLKAARSRRGMDPSPKTSGGDPDEVGKSPLGVGLRVGLELVTALVVAVAIGYGLDRLFGTTPILMVVFIPLGGAAGVMNIWRMFAPKPTDRSKTGDAKGGG